MWSIEPTIIPVKIQSTILETVIVKVIIVAAGVNTQVALLLYAIMIGAKNHEQNIVASFKNPDTASLQTLSSIYIMKLVMSIINQKMIVRVTHTNNVKNFRLFPKINSPNSAIIKYATTPPKTQYWYVFIVIGVIPPIYNISHIVCDIYLKTVAKISLLTSRIHKTLQNEQVTGLISTTELLINTLLDLFVSYEMIVQNYDAVLLSKNCWFVLN